MLNFGNMAWAPDFEISDIVYLMVDPLQEEVVVVEIRQFGDPKHPTYKYKCSGRDSCVWYYEFELSGEPDKYKLMNLPHPDEGRP